MPPFNANHCCLCSQELPPSCVESTEVQKVFPKGLKASKKIAGQRDLQDLLDYQRTLEASGSSLYVHFQCHQKFTDTRRISRDGQENSKKLRSINQLDWKSCCLFCRVKRYVKHIENKKWKTDMTMELKEPIMKKTKDRTDDLAISVLSRLENCADLVAEEAIYHIDCYSMFLSQDKHHKHKGRPIHKEKIAAFTKLCEWLERDRDCELHTMKELMEKVKEFAEKDDEIYSEKSVRRKLKEKYNNHLFFTDIPGRVSSFSKTWFHMSCWKRKNRKKNPKNQSLLLL